MKWVVPERSDNWTPTNAVGWTRARLWTNSPLRSPGQWQPISPWEGVYQKHTDLFQNMRPVSDNWLKLELKDTFLFLWNKEHEKSVGLAAKANQKLGGKVLKLWGKKFELHPAPSCLHWGCLPRHLKYPVVLFIFSSKTMFFSFFSELIMLSSIHWSGQKTVFVFFDLLAPPPFLSLPPFSFPFRVVSNRKEAFS